MRHFINHTEENYLKAIYSLSQKPNQGVSTNAIAKSLDTKASSVTDMMQKLAEKGLVSYKKYYGVQLTSSGQLIALNTIRKHRLWEVFLVDKLSFNWDEVHEIAEQLEHKYIKIFDDNYINIKKYKSIKFVLKVSGIWSSQNEFGLTFRFFLTPIIED